MNTQTTALPANVNAIIANISTDAVMTLYRPGWTDTERRICSVLHTFASQYETATKDIARRMEQMRAVLADIEAGQSPWYNPATVGLDLDRAINDKKTAADAFRAVCRAHRIVIND